MEKPVIEEKNIRDLENLSRFQDEVLVNGVCEKFGISSVRLKTMQPNIILVEGVADDGVKKEYVAKKLRNQSQLLDSSINREVMFYEGLSRKIDIHVPSYLGMVEGFEIFEKLTNHTENVNKVRLAHELPKIQSAVLTTSERSALEGEFSNKANVAQNVKKLITEVSQSTVPTKLKESLTGCASITIEAVDYLNGLPQVLTHGDYWRGNAIFSDGDLYIIDWENCQVNNSYYDLATLYYTEKLMFGSQDEEWTEVNFDDQKAMEYNFILQTIFQILPELLLEERAEPVWRKQWLDTFCSVIDKYHQ